MKSEAALGSFPVLKGIALPQAKGYRLPAKTWTKLLVPSFSDLFFVAVLAWMFLAGVGGWTALLADGDTGWHIRAGEYILDHHAVPRHDLFSYSKPGETWFAWEWLSDILYAVLFRAGGLKAIVLFSGALIALFAVVLLRYALWRGANALPALLFTLLAIGAASMHFLARPHLFTLLLAPVSLWILEADRRRPGRMVWILIPLTAIWTNLHGGFVIFLACLAILAAGTWIESRWGWPGPPARRYVALLAGCAAASLLNPYGFQLHAHILSYLRSDWIRNLIQEFQAPTFRTEAELQYEILLLAGLLLAGSLLRSGRLVEALWLLLLAHASLASLRHAPLFAAVAGPLLASEVSAWWDGMPRLNPGAALQVFRQLGRDLRPAFGWTSACGIIVIAALAFLDAPLHWPRDFPATTFPVAMAERHAELLATRRVFTTDQWGDYLIYRFYPGERVFIDGRSDFYGETLGREYLALLGAARAWPGIVERHGFEVLLLPVEWPLVEVLKGRHEWQVIADDGRTILFVLKKTSTGPNEKVPSRRT